MSRGGGGGGERGAGEVGRRGRGRIRGRRRRAGEEVRGDSPEEAMERGGC